MTRSNECGFRRLGPQRTGYKGGARDGAHCTWCRMVLRPEAGMHLWGLPGMVRDLKREGEGNNHNLILLLSPIP